MPDEVIYQEKQRSYALFYLLLVVIIVIEALAIVVQLLLAETGSKSILSLALSVVLFLTFTFILINFFYMRLKITKEQLLVSYGIFKLRIERKDIALCEPVTFSWKTYLGWGISRPGFDGTFAWTTRGNKGIRLETKKRIYVVSTNNADKICKLLAIKS